jgi:blue copper oxidase
MKYLLTTLALFVLIYTSTAQFVNPLYIPDTLTGTNFNLTVDESYVQFLPGDSTVTYGISADYLAPTIIFNKGDFVQMNVTNLLADTTTMHWHGMHVAPEDDGGPHTKILPGDTWTPDFSILDEATTFWYHPHLHSKTALHVYNGAAGMIIVRDAAEAALDLPRTYGVDDFPIILQDKSFDAGNQLIFAALSDTMMVNGTLAPYLEVPAQRVRFRLLNASNQRVYNIRFPIGNNPQLIGTDGGLLETPVNLSTIVLSPGERAEVVVDFTGATGNNMPLNCDNTGLPFGCSGGPGGLQGPPGNNLDNNDFEFMEIRVIAPTASPAGPVPATLNSHNIWAEASANLTRVKVFDTLTAGFPYYINSTPFNHAVVNDTVQLDDIEIWELQNQTNIAHPFHIHDVQFYVLDINGTPPPPHLTGRKDVVLVNVGDTIRFITKFEDFTDDVIPYMYHCHNLFHEDAGMMGQFIVIDSNEVAVPEITSRSVSYTAYPNPSRDFILIERDQTNFDKSTVIRVFDIMGKQLGIYNGLDTRNPTFTIDMRDYVAGNYFISITSEKGNTEVLKVMKQ